MAALQQLISTDAPGDVMSPSGATSWVRCGFQWYCKRILKLPDPPTGALTMGTAVHAAIGANFEQKLETKRDLAPTALQAIYRDAWARLVQGQYPGKHGWPAALPTAFRDDEEPADLARTGEVLALKYLDEVCPTIEPAAVELPVAGTINGVRVRGFIDLLDTEGRVIDLKTAARKPSEISSDYRFQVATYAQLLNGKFSGEARVDTLVKTKTPQLVQISCTINPADVISTQRMYPLVQAGIRAQWFVPNRSSYMCSRKYCAFWRTCEKEFGGEVSG